MRSTIKLRVLNAISEVNRAEWNGLLPSRGSRKYHPFTDWDFLNALEESGCVGSGFGSDTGWQAAHLWLEDAQGCAPLYVKSHSMGEYVFDHAWADAAARGGINYYPKLLCAIPFTPVRGPRIIAKSRDAETALINGIKNLCADNDLSGVHVTFADQVQAERLVASGFLLRTDQQFHFQNSGYADFDDFLAGLTSRKRKKIKAERRKAQDQVQIIRLRGDDIIPEHWDAFYRFYQDTSTRKWGQAYLNRAFFERIHETMHEQVLLILAFQDDVPIAGALNFIGGDALYGRHWGASQHIPFLHFELSYYQAIEATIEMKLARAEAGAQGEHKLARGYVPTPTYSAHYLTHLGLRGAVENFLAHERKAVAHHINMLEEHVPFKKGG